ncbi:MAG: family 20 glycosylhydrolase [Kiritimatiellae bacterium]|nr:family 20 glycosylhydrolase [Kiritimatiellia bacterium]
MKRMLAAFGLCAVVLNGSAAENFAFAPYVEPNPVTMSVDSNTLVRLDRSQTVTIACADGLEQAVEWAEARFSEWFRLTKTGWLFPSVNAPRVAAATFAGEPVAGGDEAYELAARPDGVSVRANTLQGVRYALYTLRQTILAMPRDVRKVEWYAMPALKVKDAPAMKFRGIHLGWYVNRTTPAEIEKRLRLAAYLKYNYAVIEPWGTFRSERHPWWGWKEGTMTPDVTRRLVKLGKELGITLIPQIPAFGHASMGITSPGRHAILDAHGEYAPLFESLNGWNWCISNPETLKVQFEIIDELMELFDNPPYFHIGCDEPAKPNCPRCLAADYRALTIKHITALHDGLKARGTTPMLWHDMFLKKHDPKWPGSVANGTDESITILDELPHDMVICDWVYGLKCPEGNYASLKYFKDKGFEVVSCPCHKVDNTMVQRESVLKLGLKGMLVTTWSYGQGKEKGKVFADTFAGGAAAAWGSTYEESPLWKWHYDLDLIRNLRDVVHDMSLDDHNATGTYMD